MMLSAINQNILSGKVSEEPTGYKRTEEKNQNLHLHLGNAKVYGFWLICFLMVEKTSLVNLWIQRSLNWNCC